jgi:nitrate/nitrite-specific signal transduction histidine kinase
MESLQALPLKQELAGVIYNCGVMEGGIMWGAGANTFLVYDYGEIQEKVPPLVHVISATANGMELRLDQYSELQHDQNNVAVEFVGIGFRSENAMRYEFMLAGADKKWSDPSGQRRINYAALKPGRYKFLVKAITGEGIASATTASFSFGILPPFWQRLWFVALSALLTSVLLFGLYRYRVHKLLEMERMRTAIATDLHDDIGTSLTRIALYADASLRELSNRLGDSPDERSGKLRDLLKDIGGTSRGLVDAMSDIVWAVDPKNDSLENVLIRMKTLAARMFDAKGIDYFIHVAADLSSLQMPLQFRRHFFLVFKEAVNNVIKHAHATRVDLSIRRANGTLILELRDNGTGFDTSVSKLGNGLRNMKQRASALGGEFDLSSQPGKGTTVRFTMRIA